LSILNNHSWNHSRPVNAAVSLNGTTCHYSLMMLEFLDNTYIDYLCKIVSTMWSLCHNPTHPLQQFTLNLLLKNIPGVSISLIRCAFLFSIHSILANLNFSTQVKIIFAFKYLRPITSKIRAHVTLFLWSLLYDLVCLIIQFVYIQAS